MLKKQNNKQQNKTSPKSPLVSPEPNKAGQLNMDDTPRISLVTILIRAFGKYFLVANLLHLISNIMYLLMPYMLGKIIRFIKNRPKESKSTGLMYVFLLFTILISQSVVQQQYHHMIGNLTLRVKAAVATLVYKKIFKMSVASRHRFTAGEVAAFMGVDTENIAKMVQYAFIIWSIPFMVIVCLVCLYIVMGCSIFAGFIILVLLIPINVLITKKDGVYVAKKMVERDQRVKVLNEILTGIKIIKMYAWEDSFEQKIMKYRKNELGFLQISMILSSCVQFIIASTPFLVSLCTFASYTLIAGQTLTAEKAFVGLALFDVMSYPLKNAPDLVNTILRYKISLRRLTNFLTTGEICEKEVGGYVKRKPLTDSIKIENGHFNWDDNHQFLSHHTLENINLNIKQGSLVAIVGPVGTGKSSLLSAILGEMNKTEGQVTVNGQIAYVAQQAWIRNQTLRENILFTKPYQHEKYKNIIKACALEPDLLQLAMGDLTEIGEKGINLSGGQKQRVSLARAVYNDADVYLFDDPLSAVDSHVGKHIFENVLGPEGILKPKTRVFVTQNLSFLPATDQIIVLRNRTISEIGSYEDLLKAGKEFAEYLKTHQKENLVKEDLSKAEIGCKENFNELKEQIGELGTDITNFHQNIINNTRQIKLHQGNGETRYVHHYELYQEIDNLADEEMISKYDEIDQSNDSEKSGEIIEKEKAEIGMVKKGAFWCYLRTVGYLSAILIIFCGIAKETLLIASRLWLAKWSSDTRHITNQKRDFYIGIYGALGLGQSSFVLTLVLILAYASIKASRHFHQQLLETVVHCPMSFFDSTPTGRIANRFVKDMSHLDDLIPSNIRQFVINVSGIIGTLFIISYSTPLFLAVMVPLGVMYLTSQRFYVASCRQLKRIWSVQSSPIFNHYYETIHGVSTIRAFGKVDHFVDSLNTKLDNRHAAYFASINCDRWLVLRLKILGNLVTFFAALFCVIGSDHISPGIAGMSISYALEITNILLSVVKTMSTLEIAFISIERIKEYIEKPREALPIIENNRPQHNWPTNGIVNFDNYSVRYRPGLDLVLKEININIDQNEKIGIVGRTGAGKSSITLALFRIIEPSGGSIRIDGIDISCIGLKDLREKLCIIPQDPVLFSGTIRFNIDPLEKYLDDEIWDALEMSHLKNYVSSLKNGIHYEVTEGGNNLSAGQRQLICLARALLRKSKILILDEATAAVDMETDLFIQQTIRSEFKDCTVITIAHRLNTILDYDRVLVMQHGHVIEFDQPNILLEDDSSIFSNMVKASNNEMTDSR